MKATDLRSGNLVKHQLTGETIKITGEHIEQLESGMDQDILQGIELTEDWLLRMGFEKLPHFNIGNSLFKDIGRNRRLSVSSVSTPNLMIWLSQIDVDGKTINDLIAVHNWDYDKEAYVHQIQNLHHALTGEELTIKE